MGAFDASFGPASKKPPPLNGGEVTCGGAADDRGLTLGMGLLKPAKGSGLGCCWVAGGDVAGLKFRPPNASSKPPKLDCCCDGADCIPPSEGWRSCCVGGFGLGAEAYSERMDCFRSGREGVVEPAGVDAELEDLPIEEDGGPPKKSRPSSESAALVCLGGPEDLGGGSRLPRLSVVLGLAGGSGTSPKRSTGGAARGGGGTGWLELDAARSDAPRSNFAFSCTTLSGYWSIVNIEIVQVEVR